MQNAWSFLSGRSTMSIVRIPSLDSSTISPGKTSRTYRAPIDKKPQLSLEITQPSAFFGVPLTSKNLKIKLC